MYRVYAVKGPGWAKVRPAAGGGNMMHVSLWLKVLRGQAMTPQGIKKKKKKESQVSVAAQERQRERETQETGRGEGSRMRRAEAAK